MSGVPFSAQDLEKRHVEIPKQRLGDRQPSPVDYAGLASREDVELHQQYAPVISTNGGLWRYLIGDTIEFTSVNPFRIRYFHPD